jgi:tellurite resistance protein TerC
MIGVALGIITMRFAAGIFSKLVIKFPVLKTAAYILVFNIGVQLFLEDLFLIEIPDYLRFVMSIGIILLALAYEQFKPLQVTRPIWLWFARGFSAINAVIDWALTPVFFILKLLLRMIWFVLKPIVGWVSSLFPYRSLG